MATLDHCNGPTPARIVFSGLCDCIVIIADKRVPAWARAQVPDLARAGHDPVEIVAELAHVVAKERAAEQSPARALGGGHAPVLAAEAGELVVSQAVRPSPPSGPIWFPPDMPDARRMDVVGPLNGAAWENSAEYRRDVTEYDPLRFALTYLTGNREDGRPNHLASALTRGRIAFSPLHVEMAAGAERWPHTDGRGDRRVREGWIAPRAAAKSTWTFLILPLWALAHGHRRFVLAFADAREQAEAHLANLRMELEGNTLLRQDFPHLAPLSIPGARDNARTLVLRSGATMAARGIDAKTLGIKSGSDRPDLIIGDDLEPDASNYSPRAKDKRLATLVNGVLPMNELAVVQLVGTVTMYGSIMHDLVRAVFREGQAAEWITDEGFTARYFPPIITDPDTGRRRSLWPARWSLAELEAIEHTRSFALNMANRPVPLGQDGVGWSEELFRYRDLPVQRREMFVDVAVTSGRNADQSAIAVLGLAHDGRRVVVDYVRGFRVRPGVLRDKIHRLAAPGNGITDVHVEVNQGGETWEEILSPMPPGVELHTHTSRAPKHVRIADTLDQYERGAVFHSRRHADAERQMIEHPGGHDDLIDVIGQGVGRMLAGSVRL